MLFCDARLDIPVMGCSLVFEYEGKDAVHVEAPIDPDEISKTIGAYRRGQPEPVNVYMYLQIGEAFVWTRSWERKHGWRPKTFFGSGASVPPTVEEEHDRENSPQRH